MKYFSVAGLTFLSLAIPAFVWAQSAQPVYLDSSQTAAARAHDLVSRMTLDEKAAQLEDWATAIPRLGVPDYQTWSEALHGVANSGYATVFPQAIGMAATWDPALVHQVGDIISTEGRAKYNQAQRENNHRIFYGLTFWSPNINIFRDPRWGRGQETYGEDPYLTGRMGVAFIEGVQGDDPEHPKAVATSKHYAVHSGPESTRHIANVDVAPRDLEETYLPAFRSTVMDGHVKSVMCAYNAIDTIAACANTMLLKDHLRDAWGFKGFVVSDCAAIVDVTRGHHNAPDIMHAAAISIEAGTDLSCSIWAPGFNTLADAVRQGLLKEDLLTRSAERLYTARFELGLFDKPGTNPNSSIPYSEDASLAHRETALKAAKESMVLLKNTGVLPLKPGLRSIAVVGPTAALLPSLEGNYNGTSLAPSIRSMASRNNSREQRFTTLKARRWRKVSACPCRAQCSEPACTRSFSPPRTGKASRQLQGRNPIFSMTGATRCPCLNCRRTTTLFAGAASSSRRLRANTPSSFKAERTFLIHQAKPTPSNSTAKYFPLATSARASSTWVISRLARELHRALRL